MIAEGAEKHRFASVGFLWIAVTEKIQRGHGHREIFHRVVQPGSTHHNQSAVSKAVEKRQLFRGCITARFGVGKFYGECMRNHVNPLSPEQGAT